MHIAGTWCWANLLHPFMLAAYFGIAGFPSVVDLFGSSLMIIAFSFLFSLPSLFISWLVVYLISLLRTTPRIEFLLWLIAAPLIAALNFMLIIILCGGSIGDIFELDIVMPAMIATVIVVSVRYKSFIKTLLSSKEEQYEDRVI